MDEKLSTTVDKIAVLCKQNPEFAKVLQSKICAVPNSTEFDSRLDYIYEYCIEKVIKKQAEEFYADFPIKGIVPVLVDDYVRMESFRRKDNFEDYCIALYQQIENITNKLCETKELSEIVEHMWNCQAYVKTGENITPDISNRSDGKIYSIASLIFPGINKSKGSLYSVEKSLKPLQVQSANDKIRIVTYFIGFKAMMKLGDYDQYVNITNTLSDILQMRNTVHRGNTLLPWEEEIRMRIVPMKSFYYFKFMGALAQYTEFIKAGLPYVDEMLKYARTLTDNKKTIDSAVRVKTIGYIKLQDDGKRRFK